MLTLTITDPHTLSAEEKSAVLAFLQIKTETRSADRLVGDATLPAGTTKPRKPGAVVSIVVNDPGTIKPEDSPDAGKSSQPVIDLSNVAQRDTAGTGEAADTRTAAEAFGSVPIPPVVAVAGVQAILAAPVATIPSPGPATPAASTLPSPAAGSTAAPVVPSRDSATAAASAPSAGASSAPAASTNTLDSRGMPWDHRIHSGNKAKIGAGVWRQKRGVDPAMVAQIEEQLKKLIAIPAAGTANGAAIPGPGAPAVPAPGGMSFEEFMLWVIPMTTSDPPKLTQPMLLSAITPLGLLGLPDLRVRPDLIPEALAAIKTAAGVQ